MKNSTAYQTAAHAEALKAAKELVSRLESEGPATGWGTDNQSIAIRILEADGRDEEANRVGENLNEIYYLPVL